MKHALGSLTPLLSLDGFDGKRHAILEVIHAFLPCNADRRDESLDAIRVILDDDQGDVMHPCAL